VVVEERFCCFGIEALEPSDELFSAGYLGASTVAAEVARAIIERTDWIKYMGRGRIF
jgi:hypothetical protein